MERMEAVYHEKAVEKGSLVISACGFDWIPAEIGLMFNSRQWVSPTAPNRVEAYLSLESDKNITEEEVEKLKVEIQRLGSKQDDGSYKGFDLYNELKLAMFKTLRFNNLPMDIRSRAAECLVTFGLLFHDDRYANIFEALVGTLRAAKRRKLLTYDGELLLQGVHDNVEIVLKPTPTPTTAV
ncbi:unnamed protein product [Lactuca saligna]|uniref:Costars domain-containing protein n=1 Tax=Lactuca saligna TaxID=75948 RepID=A0AA36E5K7_LACSI|nr:unnamed protein product [Lactuca saligna]